MKKDWNEKTELKLEKKYTLNDNWNTYDWLIPPNAHDDDEHIHEEKNRD